MAVDLGIKFPGEKYAALTSFAAHDATAKYELFFALLIVGTFETIGFSQIYSMTEGSDREPGLRTNSGPATLAPCGTTRRDIFLPQRDE